MQFHRTYTDLLRMVVLRIAVAPAMLFVGCHISPATEDDRDPEFSLDDRDPEFSLEIGIRPGLDDLHAPHPWSFEVNGAGDALLWVGSVPDVEERFQVERPSVKRLQRLCREAGLFEEGRREWGTAIVGITSRTLLVRWGDSMTFATVYPFVDSLLRPLEAVPTEVVNVLRLWQEAASVVHDCYSNGDLISFVDVDARYLNKQEDIRTGVSVQDTTDIRAGVHAAENRPGDPRQ